MDQPVIIHTASTSREAVRDARGQVIGYLESQRLTAKLVARDARGIIVGVYDTRSNLTRDAAGLRRVVIWGFQRVANFDSEPVGVFGADRCDAMGCVTINGSGSETFCRAVRGRVG